MANKSIYLKLTVCHQKEILKELDYFDGAITNTRSAAYKQSIRYVNNRYLPSKFDSTNYFEDTDKVLRSLRSKLESNSKHFKIEEFKCKCGKCSGYPARVYKHLFEILEYLRKELNEPITITSGLRCKTYNDSLKGSIPNSKHMKGMAADFVCKTSQTLEGRLKIKNLLMKHKYYGYTYSDTPTMGNAVHIEVI